MSSELPDGQGVWHYDETVNICNIYLNFYSHIYLYTYTYCIWTLSVTRYASVVVVSVFGVVVLFILHLFLVNLILAPSNFYVTFSITKLWFYLRVSYYCLVLSCLF